MTTRRTLAALVPAAFIAGFAVAELTGVRALGGVVLLAGGAWCAALSARLAGPVPTAALIAIALALFVLSHPLGNAIGAWPAVIACAALAGAAASAVTRIWRRTDTPAAASRIAPAGGVPDDRMRGGIDPDRR
jgi:hypothetical protein